MECRDLHPLDSAPSSVVRKVTLFCHLIELLSSRLLEEAQISTYAALFLTIASQLI